MLRIGYDGSSEEVFFILLSNSDIWKELKKWMYPDVRITAKNYLAREYGLSFMKTSNFDNYRNGDIAAYYGYVSLIEGNPNLIFTSKAIDCAAEMGYLEIVQWLLNNRNDGFSDDAIDYASMNGHLEIIKLLHQDGGHCTECATIWAAQKGHVDILMFLHEKGEIRNAYEAMFHAARNDHLEVVEYLVDNIEELEDKDLEEALHVALIYSHESIAKFLYEFGAKLPCKDTVPKLIEDGNLEMLKLAYKYNEDVFKGNLIDVAIDAGETEIVKWLHYNNIGTCTTDAIDNAATYGYLDIVIFLHRNGKGCTTDAIDNAAAYGYLDIVIFLHRNGKDCTIDALTRAIGENCVDVVEFLYCNVDQFKKLSKEELVDFFGKTLSPEAIIFLDSI